MLAGMSGRIASTELVELLQLQETMLAERGSLWEVLLFKIEISNQNARPCAFKNNPRHNLIKKGTGGHTVSGESIQNANQNPDR